MSMIFRLRVDAMARKLKSAGLKSTPQRLAVIRALAGSESHPGVEEIWAELKMAFPGISRATVYRNINLLKSLGEVVEVDMHGRGSRFDGRKPGPHPHVVCLSCGKIVDPEPAGLAVMAKEIAEQSGYDIRTYRLDLFGTCPDCRKTQTKK